MKPVRSRDAHAGRFLAATALAALLSACASHPRPTPVAPAPARPHGQGAPPAATYGAPAAPVESQPLPGSERDFVVNVGDRVYFDYDRPDIRADATSILRAQAAWLVRYPEVAVRIEGNCDERGTEEYNFALGARRAANVKAFLVANGVAMGRITTVSYGKERPIDPGIGEAAWAHDRNAHTAILSGARGG
jgi:peptidoglycan-associated lipoprotein